MLFMHCTSVPHCEWHSQHGGWSLKLSKSLIDVLWPCLTLIMASEPALAFQPSLTQSGHWVTAWPLVGSPPATLWGCLAGLVDCWASTHAYSLGYTVHGGAGVSL